MTSQSFGLRVAGIIFLLISVAHIVRVATGLQILLGGKTVPMWPSTLAAIVFGVFGVWLWRLANRNQRP